MKLRLYPINTYKGSGVIKKNTNRLLKYFILFLIGGLTYFLLEMILRGHSHWTMFILGGICFICLGLINEVLPWNMPLYQQMLIGASIITVLEFITGCVVNLALGWHIWDYSNLPFNLFGQICLQFSALWFFVSLLGIILDDYIRWIFFCEEKPRYRIFSQE